MPSRILLRLDFVAEYFLEAINWKISNLLQFFMMQGKGFDRFHVLSLMLLLVGFHSSVQGRLLLVSKPDPDNASGYARWLVSQSSWGVLNTISSELGGAPFGNVVSFSDGLPDKGTGIPYFYLTTLDPTAKNAFKDQRSSLSISEYPIGTCKADPMNPTCAKITLTGKLVLMDDSSKEAEFARRALFSKHPEMKDWPKDHNFRFYKLEIEDIFLINYFGGPKPLTVDQYLHPKKDVLLFFEQSSSLGLSTFLYKLYSQVVL